MSVRIIDKTGKFISEVSKGSDRALNRMAIDIERLSKQQVPVKHGQLRASGHHSRVALLRYSISYNKEYALYQHEGHRKDGSRVIKNHTKPGSKTHYLIDPARQIWSSKDAYLKSEIGNITL
jgi:hypothetical protein